MTGDTLYAWQELDETGWGIIAEVLVGWGGVFGTGPAPLVTRSIQVAEAMGDTARAHARLAGNRVRLAKFTFETSMTEDDAP